VTRIRYECYGADADMQDVLAAVSSSCRGRTGERGKTCGAYFPDLPPEKPSALLPRERLKIHQGWAG
jgi:hypothetical protein